MSFSFDSKIVFAVTQIQEILPVFVLWYSIFRKIDHFLRVKSSWWQLFQKGDERSLKKMDSYSIVVEAVRNHHIAHMVYLSNPGSRWQRGTGLLESYTSGSGILEKHLANEIKKSAVISNFTIFKVALRDAYNDACSVAMNEGGCKNSSYLLVESISKFPTDKQNISHVDLSVKTHCL